MKCNHCGANIDDNAKFCTNCGQATAPALHTSQMVCKACGGVLTADADKSVLVCPYCGSQELVVESDAVTIERIKSEAYQNVEMGKLGLEAANAQRQDAREQQMKADAQLHEFRKGKLSKVIIIFFVICLLAAIISFSSRHILAGFVALVQVALFVLAWLIGMQYIKPKVPRLHIPATIIGLVLIIAFFASTTVGPRKTSTPALSESEIAARIEADSGIDTYDIRNYVGKNLAAIGKHSDSGRRYEEYGCADLRLVFIAGDGTYIAPDDMEQQKDYTVVAQEPAANTTFTIYRARDNYGIPYESSTDYQSHDELVLYVSRVGEEAPALPSITSIDPVSDKHTYYVRDYVGRNAASFGESSSRGRRDPYGHGDLDITYTATDGSYVDWEDLNVLRQYIVIAQDIAPNQKLSLVYSTDSSGNEYNSVKSMNYEVIDLTVSRLDDDIIAQMPPLKSQTEEEEEDMEENAEDHETASVDAPEPSPTSTPPADREPPASEPPTETATPVPAPTSGLRPEFKEAMDSYEAFYDEYCDIMSRYMKNPTDFSLLSKYYDLLEKAEAVDAAFEKWSDSDLNAEEIEYYLKVYERVLDKLFSL